MVSSDQTSPFGSSIAWGGKTAPPFFQNKKTFLMHYLPQEIVDILQQDGEEYVKNVKNASVKILDIDKIGKRLRAIRHSEGRGTTVNVRMVKYKQGRNYTQSVSHSYFRKSNAYLGEISQVRTDGEVVFRRFHIEADDMLNLANDSDMRKYLVFMTSMFFQNNRFTSAGFSSSIKVYYIEDPSEVASDMNKRSDNLMLAITKVNNMPASEMLSACRYLNLLSESDYVSHPILRAKLSEEVILNPTGFLQKMSNRDRTLMTIIEAAISLRVLDVSGEDYVYNGLVLGRNIPEILSTLQANTEKVRYIESEITERDTDMKRMKEEDGKRKVAATQPTAADIHTEMGNLEDAETPENIALKQEQERILNANKKQDDEFTDFENPTLVSQPAGDGIGLGNGEKFDFEEE